MDTNTRVTVRRVIAAILGTAFLITFVLTLFFFSNAKTEVLGILGLAMLSCYGYALVPGLFPGQTRWDDMDEKIK